jgi:hypothetical protein
MNETRYPLCWPSNWKRSKIRMRAQFGSARSLSPGTYVPKARLSIAEAVDRIAGELRLMGIKEENCVVSTNVPLNLSGTPRGDRGEPTDTGAAIYWTHQGKQQCMAIDRYDRVADNLAAVAATLDALRAIERHGGGSILERAFMGFAQLPVGSTKPWREVFGITENDHLNRDAIETRFRGLARSRHPDNGGSHDSMAELNAAREQALQELRS